jgi:hypothetical protein
MSRRTQSAEVLPAEREAPSTGSLAGRLQGSLSPIGQRRVSAKASRHREGAATDVLAIEDEAMVAEASVVGRGVVKAGTERVERALHRERQLCLVEAAHDHQECLHAVCGLSEDTRAIFGQAVNATALRYCQGVERRAAGL